MAVQPFRMFWNNMYFKCSKKELSSSDTCKVIGVNIKNLLYSFSKFCSLNHCHAKRVLPEWYFVLVLVKNRVMLWQPEQHLYEINSVSIYDAPVWCDFKIIGKKWFGIPCCIKEKKSFFNYKLNFWKLST